MIVAVASGKGGTGKTTVTASLASTWGRPVAAVDLDVEEPNLHLFLKPEALREENAFLEVPTLPEPARCTACGACVDLCQFKALSLFGQRLTIFPELCHGCEGCFRVCPTGALVPGQRELGELSCGRTSEGLPWLSGRLRIGEAMSPPLMNQVRARMKALVAEEGVDVLVDAPPGVSCPALAAVQDADVILLVTEPTPFGLHDLKLAREAFKPLGRPMGVVINRAGLGDRGVHDFCRESGLPVVAEIPFSRAVAVHYAQGGVVAQMDEAMRERFTRLGESVRTLAGSRKEAAHA